MVVQCSNLKKKMLLTISQKKLYSLRVLVPEGLRTRIDTRTILWGNFPINYCQRSHKYNWDEWHEKDNEMWYERERERFWDIFSGFSKNIEHT